MSVATKMFDCPVCEGQGEVWVSGDPRGPNVVTRQCWGCKGHAEVSRERLGEIAAELLAEWEGP